MLNRSAVVIIPKQPFLDWVNAVDDLGGVTADDMQKMLYLVQVQAGLYEKVILYQQHVRPLVCHVRGALGLLC